MAVQAGSAPLQRRWFPTFHGARVVSARLRRLGKLELVALGAFTLLTIFLLLVPLFVPHSTTAAVGKDLTGPSGAHWMGIDEQGRDVFSRVLVGMRTSWFAAFGVIASGVVIGGLIGLVAGMSGGWIDNVLMRTTDVFLALPGPLLVLAVVSALGPSLQHTLIAVAIVWWPFYSRIVRGEVRAIAARSHVEAARMGGAGRLRVAFRHVLPGTFGAILVTASLDIGALLLTLAGLSFLGLGSPPPAPELGAMTSKGLSYLFTSWWVPVFPALGVFILAFVGNLAGDAVRDVVEG
jgi:ABC-type dipeptide/oligopeptide/nickel transport system permease subunit